MVKRDKFLQEAKADPPRFYRSPNDVLRDRRLSDDDRREILLAWAGKMRAGDSEPALLELADRALHELGEDGDGGEDNSAGAKQRGSG